MWQSISQYDITFGLKTYAVIIIAIYWMDLVTQKSLKIELFGFNFEGENMIF